MAALIALPVASQGGDVVDAGRRASASWVSRRLAFAGVGLAVGGLVRTIARGRRRPASLVIATFLHRHPRAGAQAAGPVLHLSLYQHLGQPMAGILRPGRDRGRGGHGRRRRWLLVRVGSAAAGHRQVTSGGGTPGSSAWSRSRPSCMSPGTSGSRPPATRSGRRRSGCWRRPSGIVPAGFAVWWSHGRPALPVEGIVARASSRASSRRPTSSCWRPPTGAATSRSSTRWPAGRRRCWRCSSGSPSSASGWGSPARSGSSRCWPGFLVLQRPWRDRSRRDGGGRPGERGATDSAILFALATGVMIATYTAIDRVGTRLIAPCPVRGDPVGRHAPSCWSCGSRSWPAAICCATAGGGPAGGRRRLADARRVPVHPRRPERRAAVGRRAAARIGDGLRGGLGLGPDGRGGRSIGGRRRGSGPRR